MIDESEGAGGSGPLVSGWRRTIALALIYWYLIAVLAAIAAFLLVWVYAFSVSPADEYWTCMDRQIPGLKQAGWQPNEVFLGADSGCSRPAELSDRTARSKWVQHWNAP